MATTIQVDEDTKKKLQTFGTKGESYNEIINRIYTLAVKEQLHEFLYAGDAIPIDEAIARAKKRWSK
jgi:predicted CopG family antitoxin